MKPGWSTPAARTNLTSWYWYRRSPRNTAEDFLFPLCQTFQHVSPMNFLVTSSVAANPVCAVSVSSCWRDDPPAREHFSQQVFQRPARMRLSFEKHRSTSQSSHHATLQQFRFLNSVICFSDVLSGSGHSR